MDKKLISIFSLFVFSACSISPGPDKSIAGAILGAGWGTGAGAIVGNQVNATGPGMAIGAGIGAVGGLATGIGLDMVESGEIEQQRELDALKVQVAANHRNILGLQRGLDSRQRKMSETSITSPIYFDADRASLRSGSAASLQRLAEAIKLNPNISNVEVHGHSDNLGTSEKNIQLSEARARTVATFLASQGVSMDEIKIVSHGTEQPITSNDTEAGRQLNRRVEIILKR